MRIDDDHRFVFKHEGITHSVYRDGQGPAVLLMHELPGMSPKCIEVAGRLIGKGFSVYLPLFFGEPRQHSVVRGLAGTAWLCVRHELNALSTDGRSEISVWLRALCRRMLGECGGRGVGVIGMCLTGHLVISVMLDESVLVPVLCEPSIPLVAITEKQRAALGVPQEDVARAVERAKSAPVLGFRFVPDKRCPPERFETLKELFGTCFQGSSLPVDPRDPHAAKPPHSVLTEDFVDQPEHPTRKAFDAIVERLGTLR